MGLTGPLLFTAAGFLLSDEALGWLHLGVDSSGLSSVVEATLALVLFSDAARIDVRRLRRGFALPTRLLGIGLPLTMLAGAGVAKALFPALGWREAALLGVMLAPTDAALGQPVVADPRVPVRIRQGLNVESGLNDGIAMPFFTVLLASVVAAGTGESTGRFVEEIGKQLGWGVFFGLLVGAVAAGMARWPRGRSGAQSARALLVFSVPFVAYGTAVLPGGSGFIAAFVAGLVMGPLANLSPPAYAFAEDTGQVLTLLAFFGFGGVILVDAVHGELGRPVLYALLSLTVVRLIPVGICLLGSGERAPTVAFCGWFGPRGLASVLLLALLLESAADQPGVAVVAEAVSWTVVLSVVLHGLTAGPWTTRYSIWSRAQVPTGPSLAPPEIFEHRLRQPFAHR